MNMIATVGRPPIVVQFGENTGEAVRQAGIAQNAAEQAQASASVAEAFAGPTFADTTAGLAGTSVGESFAVESAGIVTVYLHEAGPVATEQRQMATTAALAASGGAGLSGFIASGTGAEASNVEKKLRRYVDVLDFIPDDLHAGIKDGTNATDLTAYIQSAINAVIADGGDLFLPAGNYLVTDALEVSDPHRCNLLGTGKELSNIIRDNADGPIIRLSEASSASQQNGYYYRWEGLSFRFDPVATISDTDAIGISFETGGGDRTYGHVNFLFRDIQIVGAYDAISNDWGAGDPPNIWGWTWDNLVIANFVHRALYLTNGGVGEPVTAVIAHRASKSVRMDWG